LITVVFGFYFAVFRKEKREYSLIRVNRASVVEEVSESGQVKTGEEIKLGFKSQEKIEEIFVNKGDEVKPGQTLAKLETTKLSFQLTEALSSLKVAQAQLDKLLAGASNEEVKIASTAVNNSRTALRSARQNLKNIETTAGQNLAAAYEDGLNVLEDAYLRSDNALTASRSVYLTYFNRGDEAAMRVKDSKDKIESGSIRIKLALEAAESNPLDENIDRGLAITKAALDSILQALAVIRQTSEEPLYREAVSSTDKTALDSQRTNINTILTSVINNQQTILSTKTTNTYNVDAAEAQVLAAEGALNKAEDELSQLKTPARQEDVALYQGKLKEAAARLDVLRAQISEAELKSPTAGQIAEVFKKVGEIAQPAEAVISLVSVNLFEVEVDIYEEDILKIKIGNPAEIKISAFGDKTFSGKVISVDQVEKLIEGVVYYKVTIDFDNPPAGLKPGMTADVVIKTASRENVLVIPETAVLKKDGKTMVEVSKNGILTERAIETGLKGSDEVVEVVSGLSEGEEVVVPLPTLP